MVSNKKSEQHMIKELEPFLGGVKTSSKFCTWLKQNLKRSLSYSRWSTSKPADSSGSRTKKVQMSSDSKRTRRSKGSNRESSSKRSKNRRRKSVRGRHRRSSPSSSSSSASSSSDSDDEPTSSNLNPAPAEVQEKVEIGVNTEPEEVSQECKKSDEKKEDLVAESENPREKTPELNSKSSSGIHFMPKLENRSFNGVTMAGQAKKRDNRRRELIIVVDSNPNSDTKAPEPVPPPSSFANNSFNTSNYSITINSLENKCLHEQTNFSGNRFEPNSSQKRLIEQEYNRFASSLNVIDYPIVTPGFLGQPHSQIWPDFDMGELYSKQFSIYKFGHKLHYANQTCRYDGFCTRPNCSFIHAAKKTTTVQLNDEEATLADTCVQDDTTEKHQSLELPQKERPNPPPKNMSEKNSQVVPNCPVFKPARSFYGPYGLLFAHRYSLINRSNVVPSIPLNCKFGSLCRNPKCLYKHSSVPDKSQLKWVAPKTREKAMDEAVEMV